MYESVINACRSCGVKYTENADMAKHTTFRIGGPARLLVEPNSVDSLEAILKACKAEGVKPIVLGNGSNVLVRDEGIDGVVIVMGDEFSKIEYAGNDLVRVQAGAKLVDLCRFALEYSLGGLEFAFGIPGTVGGAAFMNAGAYGGEMKDVVWVVNHIDLDGNRGSYQGSELDFSYRHSAYVDSDLIITSVIFHLEQDNAEGIKNNMDDVQRRRKAKQPLEYPSAGSTFKRPEGYFAAALIDECGLKGYSVGGAQVSEKHAGFVINTGGATAADVLALMDHVQKTVLEQKGVALEPEVRII
ncbi:MAG: UDP-N-acetylmuramate dehydrogenase [Clostridia bacterium]|nr:UDP-N-acetylmuramate dehydrogenase [Clostridia bacterium]MBR6512230.1 UDP-N-acetylmuramate dehydrogenase [Clostridia bacterium]